MIGTLEIKQQQLKNGAFRTGSGGEVMLIMGSCRSVAYLNYLNEYNKINNKYTIYFIDPFNFNWNLKDERVDYNEELEKQEKNEVLLTILSSVNIFIHEYYQNFGIFNTSENGEKNIYDFGMSPETDICIPNFNNYFILAGDIISFDSAIKEKCKLDYLISNKLSKETEIDIYTISKRNIEKFYSICRISDIPEMENHFKENLLTTRFFWTSNHISKHFSLSIFRFLNDKYLKLNLSDEYWKEISKEDIYANNYTYLTDLDIKMIGYKWDEQVKDIKEIITKL